jgi:hypothetical protein
MWRPYRTAVSNPGPRRGPAKTRWKSSRAWEPLAYQKFCFRGRSISIIHLTIIIRHKTLRYRRSDKFQSFCLSLVTRRSNGKVLGCELRLSIRQFRSESWCRPKSALSVLQSGRHVAMAPWVGIGGKQAVLTRFCAIRMPRVFRVFRIVSGPSPPFPAIVRQPRSFKSDYTTTCGERNGCGPNSEARSLLCSLTPSLSLRVGEKL